MRTKQKIVLDNETLLNIYSIVNRKSVSQKEMLTKCITNWIDEKKVFCINKPFVVQGIVDGIISKTNTND